MRTHEIKFMRRNSFSAIFWTNYRVIIFSGIHVKQLSVDLIYQFTLAESQQEWFCSTESSIDAKR